MSDRELDNLIDRISRSLGDGLTPVRPIAPAWALASGLVLVCAAVGIGGALLLGPHGIRKMDALEIALIFPTLALLFALAAATSVAEAIPGSRRLMPPGLATLSTCAALAAVFVLVFHDYGTERFLPQGLTCLKAGLLHALPAGIGVWLVLRRGFAVQPAASGLVRGALAGLAGVTMLEIHCVNFELPHVLLWHIGVIPLAALAASAFAARRSA